MPVTHWGCDLGDYWSWSVRPDLWPAGSSAWVPHRMTLAMKYHAPVPQTVEDQVVQYSRPGVAEALVLQDLVEVWPYRREGGVQWVEVDPCP